MSTNWNFRLPEVELELAEPEFDAEEGMIKAFSIRRLVHALQGGIKKGNLQHYLSFYSENVVKENMNSVVEGFPAIFYAVASNDDKILRV
jgi:hypothetical protein